VLAAALLSTAAAANYWPPVSVGVVALWTGGPLPPYTKWACASMAAQRGGVATLYLVVDNITQSKVPSACLDPRVRLMEKGTNGIAHMFANGLSASDGEQHLAFRERLKRLFVSAIDKSPRLLIELKPAWLWVMREALLGAGHSHATYTDLDVVFGDLSRWLRPELVHPYDVTTWAYEDDTYRLFLRGQWSMFRLQGEEAAELAQRFKRCSYLSTRLEAWLEQRAAVRDAAPDNAADRALALFPDNSEELAQGAAENGTKGCATFDGAALGHFLSAEGCYSCVVFTGTPTLRVAVRPVGFSDHSAMPVWWAYGKLGRLDKFACRPRTRHSELPPSSPAARANGSATSAEAALHKDVAAESKRKDSLATQLSRQLPWCHGRFLAAWLRALRAAKDSDAARAARKRRRVPSGGGGAQLIPVRHGADCAHLSWIVRSCPGSGRCLSNSSHGAPRGAVGVFGEQAVIERVGLSRAAATRHLPCAAPRSFEDIARGNGWADNASTAGGDEALARCEPMREAALFHYRVWDHMDPVDESASKSASMCSMAESHYLRAAFSASFNATTAGHTICDIFYPYASRSPQEWLVLSGGKLHRTCIGYSRTPTDPCEVGLRCDKDLQTRRWLARRKAACWLKNACVGTVSNQARAVQRLLESGRLHAVRCGDELEALFHVAPAYSLPDQPDAAGQASMASKLVGIHFLGDKFRRFLQVLMRSVAELEHPSCEVSNRSQSLRAFYSGAPSPPPQPLIVFGITSKNSEEDLGRLEVMWGAPAREGYPVLIFSAAPPPRPLLHQELTHVQLSSEDGLLSDSEYPPVQKNFHIWHALAHYQGWHDQTRAGAADAAGFEKATAPSWYARCDADTFVDPARLAAELDRYFGNPRTQPWYTGHPGQGRAHERKVMRMNFSQYAVGGSCEIVSAAALALVKDELLGCARRTRSTMQAAPTEKVRLALGHSDVELARCLSEKGISFRVLKPEPAHRSMFVSASWRSGDGQLPGVTFDQLATVLRQRRAIATLHPVKSLAVAHYLAAVVHEGRTPVLPWTTDVFYENEGASTMCMHNPAALRMATACCNSHARRSAGTLYGLSYRTFRSFCLADRCSISLSECAPSIPARCASAKDVKLFLRRALGVFVTQAPNEPWATRRAHALQAMLMVRMTILGGVPGRSAYSGGIDRLTAGELGLRDSFRIAAQDAVNRRASALLWLEHDAIEHRELRSRWKALLACPRCFAYMISPGGALLLGASEWSLFHSKTRHTHPWSVDVEPELTVLAGCGKANQTCYNALYKTQGTFACMLSRHVLPLLLQWLKGSNRPIDHFWEFLAAKGYVVRVAYPNLFAMAVSGHSQVAARPLDDEKNTNYRYRLMHWDIQQYAYHKSRAAEGGKDAPQAVSEAGGAADPVSASLWGPWAQELLPDASANASSA